MNVIEFNHVWKKFKRGRKFNSLRDTVPNLFRNGNGKIKDGLKEGEFWALRDVSFNVKKGEVMGIIGPNGAGKSTILKLLFKILAPNNGDMQMNGRVSGLIEVTAGFHPELTGRENVYLNGTIVGMRKKEIDEKFEQIVDFSGVREFIDTPVKRYSSGMFARLGFSVVAHMDPDILLVDEVLAVGDMAFQAKCAEKMRELLDSGATIVLVSHNLSLVQSLSNRVILIDKGQIVKEGNPEQIIPDYRDIVYKQREEVLKKKLSNKGYKVNIKEESPIEIVDSFLYNGDLSRKESFFVGSPISVRVEYEAKKKIYNPVFKLDIVRSDSVLCCSSNTKDASFALDAIKGPGSIDIDLGNLNLAPGIYVAKISIWDSSMIHQYAVRNRDIFKIEISNSVKPTSGVFFPDVKWKMNKIEKITARV